MKHVTLITASLLLLISTAKANDNPATAPTVTMQNWFPSDGATSYTSASLGATASGYAVCNGSTETDDAWLKFTAVTVGVKVTIQNPGFDAVVELFDASLTPLLCVNAAGANATEILRYNLLTQGALYYVRIHSLNGVSGTGNFNYAIEYLPQTEVRSGWYPNPQTDLGLTGYRIYENTNRKIFTPMTDAALIEATRWLFIDTSNNQQHIAVKNGTSSLMLLDDIGDLCFGKTYNVYVEVRVEGFWCGYSVMRQVNTEAVPTSELEPGYGGQYYNLNQFVKARYLGHNQVIQFELVTDNFQTTVLHDTISSYCFFTYVDCIRYNKIYQIRIRAKYCGSDWGPWSAPDFIITNPLPYTNVKSQFCNQSLYAGATIQCDYVWGTNQYAWQLAPIDPNDPTMTPIGPAIVAYTPHTSCYLGPLGLQYGATYRVAAKPFLGFNNLDGCNDHQEGDYGQFCPITIIDPFQFSGETVQMDLAEETEKSSAHMEEKSTPVSVIRAAGDAQLLMVDLRQLQGSGQAKVTLRDLSGRIVSVQSFERIELADYLAIPFSPAAAGLYIATIDMNGSTYTGKVWWQ